MSAVSFDKHPPNEADLVRCKNQPTHWVAVLYAEYNRRLRDGYGGIPA